MKQKDFKKLKVGDKVMIKSIPELDYEFTWSKKIECYESICSFVPPMKEYAGKIVTILRIGIDHIHIKEDEGIWQYSYDVLDDIERKVYECYAPKYDRTTVYEDWINEDTGEVICTRAIGWYQGEPDEFYTKENSDGNVTAYFGPYVLESN